MYLYNIVRIVEGPTTTTSRPPPPSSMVSITITSPSIRIQEVGSTVNFTCRAESVYSNRPLKVQWQKAEGNLPRERTYIQENEGMLIISNVQETDSGVYVCQATDGINVKTAETTLIVPSEYIIH